MIKKVEKVIVLDIGQVCCHINKEGFAKTLDLPLDFDFSNEYKKLFVELECGNLEFTELILKIYSLLNYKFTIDDLTLAFQNVIGDDIDGMLDVSEEIISKGFKIVWLSDTSFVHMEKLKKLKIYKNISAYVTSYQVGYQKPHEAMYMAIEKQFCHGNVPFLFTDDKLENIYAARQRGWQAYHFKSARLFLKYFRELCMKNEF